MRQWQDLARDYMAVWNVDDATQRRALIATTWGETACHRIQSGDFKGHSAIEGRVVEAYDAFIAQQDQLFEFVGEPARIGDLIQLRWQMRPKQGGTPLATGCAILLTDENGRIVTDYQFMDPA